LIVPYKFKGITRFFIEQYLRGAGKELSGSFWNIKSSSRLAFDLFSWTVDLQSVKDFSFEYKEFEKRRIVYMKAKKKS
jgi:hypothetical protein